MPDFIADYMPSPDQLTPEQVESARNRLVAYQLQLTPGEDVRPNTVLGDRLITPFAMLLAAFEEGARRFQNDLQLERVAAGEVYNCDFVKSYLKNFGTLSLLATTTHTQVRLIFQDSGPRDLPGTLRFSVGTQVFALEPPIPGNLQIRSPGTSPGGPNDFELQALSLASWYVDVPVSADLVEDVAAGSRLELDQTVSGLSDALVLQALTAQNTGMPVTRSAMQTLSLMYAAGGGLRGQMAQLVRQLIGRSTAVSVVQTGDAEMLRAGLLFGNQSPCVDLVVANPLSTTIETSVVWCKLVSGSAGGADGMFVGEFRPQHPPLRILSMLSATAPDSAVDLVALPSYNLIAEPKDASTLPALTGAYGLGWKYWIACPVPRDDGASLIPLDVVGGEQGAWISVRYIADQSVRLLEHKLRNPELVFGGYNLLVRRAAPFWISSMTIGYRRTNGRTFNRAQALRELVTYFSELVHPALYSSARVADILYYAGASSLVSITVSADTRTSPGTLLRKIPTKDPRVVPLEVIDEETLPIEVLSHTSLDDLVDVEVDDELDAELRTEWALSPRNRVPMLASTSAIQFQEVA